MKRITSLFIILIFISQPVHGEQIYSFDSTIDSNTINHVELTVLRDLKLQLEGSTSGVVSFLALDSSNYQLWSEFLNYLVVDNRSLFGDFDFIFSTSLEINSTLHLLFINNETTPVDLNITVEELTTTTEGAPFNYSGFIIAGLVVSFIYKKSNKN